MNSLKLKLIFIFVVAFAALLTLAPKLSAFDPLEEACKGGAISPACQQSQKQETQGNPNPIAGPNGIIQTAANIIALVAGVAAVIIIIISGLMFVTAGGSIGGQRAGDSPTRAKNARAALIHALLGLVVIALAWSLITFVTHRVITT